jgi:cytidylate kinase
LAKHFDFAYLDTGSLYRAAAFKLLMAKADLDDAGAAAAAAAKVVADDLSEPRLRDEGVGEAASRVAALAEVRTVFLEFQRRFAKSPPGGRAGAVLDGRDIGTVVCPDADVKFFVTAAIEARAKRRHEELLARGKEISYAQVLDELKQRDERDQARATAPLRPAADAHLLDTTNLDIEAAFRAALAIIAAR